MNLHIENSSNLKRAAYELIDKMQLNENLAHYGELKLVGSATYNLMTWRDIDFDLIMEEVPSNETYFKIVKNLFEIPGVKKITLVDNRNQQEKNRPKSMYIGLSYEDTHKDIWKIDIRVLPKEFVTNDKIETLIKTRINDELRAYILEIKVQVHTNPKYHKEFSSVDIYNAVLLNNVKDLSGFENYLATLGKSL